MRGDTPPPPNRSLWSGALLGTGTNLPYFYLTMTLYLKRNDIFCSRITHIHLVPRLRMRGAIPPLSHTSSCRGT
jgi:hypothetical protein